MSAATFVTGLIHHVRASATLVRRAGHDRQAREALVALRRAADGYAFPPLQPWTGEVRLAFRPPRHWANISDYEALVLAALVRAAAPRTVFEIGTFDGYSAWIMARNSEATVYTLDLPCGQNPASPCPGDAEAGHEAPRGVLVRDEPRVRLLEGDSLAFDFSPWAGMCDFVFVDGAHGSPHAEADTRTALALVAQRGAVLWHDCDRRHPAVWQAVRRVGRVRPVRSIPGTRFAILPGAL